VPGEIIPSREFYDYEAKYLDEGSQVIIPADLPAKTAARVRELAIAAFQAIDCAGMARVDFLLPRRTDDLWSTRSTRSPGSPRSACTRSCGLPRGSSIPALLDRLIALALERHAQKQALRTSVT
jgi:D-alanine-D-alanine ligase